MTRHTMTIAPNCETNVSPDRIDPERSDPPDIVEGLGSPDDEGGSPYPLRDMMVRTEVRTVREVVRRINASRYVMNPGFQRDYVWNDKQASKLIESCIMRLPLPVFYVTEGPDGRITVVDGLQRLHTFTRFLNDKFKLAGLGTDHPLHNRYFSDLPIDLRERVEDTQLTLYVLDRGTPPRASLDIFERVNSGTTLTRQQMRHALYFGRGTKWLAAMASESSFLRATGHTLSHKTMRDREVINRFAAFHLFGYEAYQGGDMDAFLARAIQQLNQEDDETFDSLSEAFTNSMDRNYELFSNHAFRKSLGEQDVNARRTPINVSLFDVLSYAGAKIPDRTIRRQGNVIRTCVYTLLENDEFLRAITLGTNGTVQVFLRFDTMLIYLEDYFR